ncbi:hypothetical protein F4805DRAFT_471811 [Annulohypoxylon moriforme]|nr:hypothetical protein F4805DRAFT_471811 [Annulohypoxylon moriforme]
MHFQQAVPREIRSLASKLEPLPTTEQNPRPRPPVVAILLLALLALPVVHVLGESWGLRPVPATCFSLGTVLSCVLVRTPLEVISHPKQSN